ncbi:hypothetical protein M5689_011091 [Euphorbia peplus]|nr:hypothetical protein M5689_011091 [Euphorbia peplus]
MALPRLSSGIVEATSGTKKPSEPSSAEVCAKRSRSSGRGRSSTYEMALPPHRAPPKFVRKGRGPRTSFVVPLMRWLCLATDRVCLGRRGRPKANG